MFTERALTLLAFCVTACTASRHAECPPAPADAAPPARPAPPAAGEAAPGFERIPEFNGWAAKSGLDRDLPALVTRALSRVDEPVDTTLDVKFTPREAPTRASVTLVEDGFRDDSVRGQRYRLTFARDTAEAGWRLRDAVLEYRCWRGRGHEDFSSELCH